MKREFYAPSRRSWENRKKRKCCVYGKVICWDRFFSLKGERTFFLLIRNDNKNVYRGTDLPHFWQTHLETFYLYKRYFRIILVWIFDNMNPNFTTQKFYISIWFLNKWFIKFQRRINKKFGGGERWTPPHTGRQIWAWSRALCCRTPLQAGRVHASRATCLLTGSVAPNPNTPDFCFHSAHADACLQVRSRRFIDNLCRRNIFDKLLMKITIM